MRNIKLKQGTLTFLFCLLLTVQAVPARAVFSPLLGEMANKARQDILTSRQVNGVGSFWVAMVKAEEVRRKLIEDKKASSSVPALFTQYFEKLKEILLDSVMDPETFGRTFKLLAGFLIPNSDISACLSDDILEVFALQEALINELLKAGLLGDSKNASILWEDYRSFKKKLGDLVSQDERYNYTHDSWFPGLPNYYIKCPYGDFTQAWKEVKSRLNNLEKNINNSITSFSASGIKDEAKRRAIRRAQDYIARNTLRLSFGGGGGSPVLSGSDATGWMTLPKDLFLGSGIRGVSANIKNTMHVIDGIVNMVMPDVLPVRANFEIFRRAWELSEEKKTTAKARMETALRFNLSLNQTSEENLKGIEATLLQINEKIKAGVDGTGGSILDFCEKLSLLPKTQCKDRTGGEAPSCK